VGYSKAYTPGFLPSLNLLQFIVLWGWFIYKRKNLKLFSAGKVPLKIHLKVSCRWKYVHIETVWQLTSSVRHCESLTGESMYISSVSYAWWQLSHTEIFLLVKVCTCRAYMTINDICETLKDSYKWKYVHVLGISCLMSSVKHWG
jgi:hypothetical protein